MEADSIKYTPEENITKQSIEEILPTYIEDKRGFFMLAAITDNEEALRQAGEIFPHLLGLMWLLIDLTKPDNIGILEQLEDRQKEIERLQNLTTIKDNDVDNLRKLCEWLDTRPLRPHLKTQPNIASCKPHTQTTFK